MPSRAYTSFLHTDVILKPFELLVPGGWHVNLIPHFYEEVNEVAEWCGNTRVNALSGLYIISTKLIDLYNNSWKNLVSMPFRAYTSFLRYPFKNLGFMRFPEPVFAGIYQNILTTAVFRAC